MGDKPAQRFRTILALLVFLGAVTACTTEADSGPVPSQTPEVIVESPSPLPCNPRTTLGQQGCAQRALARADATLHDVVEQLWVKASKNARLNLTNAQIEWEEYRAAACKSAADAFEGGSLAGVVVLRCQVRLTRDRIQDLVGFSGPTSSEG